jgi:hypothetical protein
MGLHPMPARYKSASSFSGTPDQQGEDSVCAVQGEVLTVIGGLGSSCSHAAVQYDNLT